MRKLCTDEVGEVKMKKNEKKVFCNLKKCICFTAIFGFSFGFAFQRWFVELEKALLEHFKSLKMEKNWERSVKVFGDQLVQGARRW
jgi:hypothetical protein